MSVPDDVSFPPVRKLVPDVSFPLGLVCRFSHLVPQLPLFPQPFWSLCTHDDLMVS